MKPPREVPDLLTPLDLPSLWNALLLQWEILLVEPKRCAIELKLAHIHLETGLRACHRWNIGNRKKYDGSVYDWCSFVCGEEVAKSELPRLKAMGYLTVAAEYQRNGVDFCSIKLYPPHPWCRFDAFETLPEGVRAHLAYLLGKRATKANALEALMTGDPQAYNDALYRAGYATAWKERYLKTLKERLEIIRRETRDYDWGDVS